MDSTHRLLLKQSLDQIEQVRRQAEELDQEIARVFAQQQAAIERLCAVPGTSVTAAFQIVAEIGPEARTFVTPGKLASWTGLCPGREESAGVSISNRCARGNPTLKRVLTQCAWAAGWNKKVNSIAFSSAGVWYSGRQVLGPRKATIAVAHRMLIVIWKLLHERETYTDTGCQLTPETIRRRMLKCIKGLEALGFRLMVSQTGPDRERTGVGFRECELNGANPFGFCPSCSITLLTFVARQPVACGLSGTAAPSQ
jgi:transposase